MKFIILLRGINVGTSIRVEMKRLKLLFESLGFSEVSTYINSGNVIFKSNLKKEAVQKKVNAGLKREFKAEIPTLVKTSEEIKRIADAIPASWQNNDDQKTDVAYLFEAIDSKNILESLPVKKDFVDIRYIPGALFWNVSRKNYNKSHLNKLISHKIYREMTVRNVNTARYLASEEK